MSPTIVWPSDTVDVIDGIRHAIGRDITFIVIASEYPCPTATCNLDPVTDLSTDSFCQVCSGAYWIPVYSGYVCSGHITWAPSDFANWYTGGIQVEGTCRVQIKYTPEAYTVVDEAVWVEVDNKIMQINRKMLRGVQPVNRILIDLDEKEKSK